MSDAQDDRYLRYCIARLSAYPQRLVVAGQRIRLHEQPAGGRIAATRQMEDWDRFFQILQNEDPHQPSARHPQRPRSGTTTPRPGSRMPVCKLPTWPAASAIATQYQKPVIYDECKYEGNIPQGWGNLDAKTMTQRFWLGTMSGCYVGHGETYMHPEDILWWSKGGVLHGESPQRIQWLKDFMAQAPPFDELQPLGDDQGRYLLAKPGEYYLLYCLGPQPQTIELAGDRPYKVDLVDPWEMTVLPLGTAQPGEYTVQPAKVRSWPTVSLPYAPGEKLRPEVKISASPMDGVPPLTVTFRSETDGAAAWDFGDGTTSTDNPATHTFDTARPVHRDAASHRFQRRQRGRTSCRSPSTGTPTNRSSGPGLPTARRRQSASKARPGAARTAAFNCPTASRGAGPQPATACSKTCAACGPSPSPAGSSRTACRSARAATASCSVLNETTPASTWSVIPTADCGWP